MKTQRTRLRALKDLLWGLVSLLVLAGLVVGVPAALASLAGWPLPRSAPHLDAVTHALTQTNIPDSVLIKGAACVCWAAWAILMVCVVVEAAAWLGCYTARRLSFAGPFQVWASRLVASALLVFSSFGGLVRPAAAAPLRLPAPVVQMAPGGTPVRPLRAGATQRQARPLRVDRSQRQARPLRASTAESMPAESLVPAGTAETPLPPGAKHYTVQPDQGRRYDTLWSIAERHLGDPLRWPEIAQLNQGRVSAQRRFGNPHWIFPGEVLVMPADAVDVDGSPLPAAPVTAPPTPPPPATAPARLSAPTPARTPTPVAAPTASSPTTVPQWPPSSSVTARAGRQAAVASGVPTAPRLPDVPDVAGAAENDVTPTDPAPTAPARATSTPTTTPDTAPTPTTPLPTAAIQDPRANGASATAPMPTTASPSPPANAGATSGSRAGAQATPLPQDPAPDRAPRADRPLRAPSSPSAKRAPVSEAKPDTRAARAVELGVSLLLGAGVIAVLRRLRNAQQRRRRPGRHIPLPDTNLAQTEAMLRREANLDEAAMLDRALRAMAAGLAAADLEAPAVAGVHLTSRAVEVVLAEPTTDAPACFRASGDGRRWICDRNAVGAELPAGTLQPLPTLVTLGRSDKGLVLANLESPGVVSVSGGEGAREFVRRAGIELATSTARGNDSVDVVLVGFGDGLEAIEGVRVAISLEDVIADVEARSHEAVESVMRMGCASTLGSRIAGYDGEFAPLVVVCSTVPTAALAKRLVAAATPECSGVVALVAGAMTGASWRLRLTGDQLEVPPLGLSVQTEGLTKAETEEVAELVALAADPADVAELPEDWPWDPYAQTAESESESAVGIVNERPESAGRTTNGHVSSVKVLTNGQVDVEVSTNGNGHVDVTTDGHRTDDVDHDDLDADKDAAGDARVSDPGPYVDELYTVSVDVMGPVRIVGGQKPIERSKSIELVTLLAMRRQGITSSQAEAALWPNRAPASNTLNTITTVARTRLGRGTDGMPLIVNVRRGPDNGALRTLSRSVSSDYERFSARVRHAERRPVRGAIETLRDALALVRGQPFDATPAGGYEWALGGLAESIRRDIVDAAVSLGDLCLTVGDVKGARWATDRGRQADPYHEGLARLAMTAANLDGDRTGVDDVMTSLLVGLEEGVEPYDSVQEETAQLHRELRHAAPASVS